MPDKPPELIPCPNCEGCGMVEASGGFTCECCERNTEMLIDGKWCNECATSHRADILASQVAAEKETLEKEIERLREALGIIAAKKYDVWAFGECKSIAINTLGELEAARTADIKEKEMEKECKGCHELYSPSEDYDGDTCSVCARLSPFVIKQVEQPEVSPVQTFYGYFCDGPEEDPRMEMIAFISYLTIEEARKRAMAYATENSFSGFILMTAREIATARV